MNLLAAALYDPAAAVSKATTALLAMTALDTVNLRLAVTVPAHGKVRFRLRCAIVGATTPPVILLGVMVGAVVKGRVQPLYAPVTAPAATQVFMAEAEFTVSGLAAGATNFDAAYAVQVLVAATNIKYGGPDTNAGANAWGGFVFEAFDPQPIGTAAQLAVDANGRVDVGKHLGTACTLDANNALNVSTKWVNGTLQTAGDIPAKTNSLTFTGANKVDASVRDWVGDAIPARNVAGVPLVDLKYTLGTISPAAAGSVRADAVTGAVGSVTARVTANTDQVNGTAQTARDLGAQLDVATSTRLAAAGYTAPDNASIAAVKAKTDSLNFTAAGKLDVNVLKLNGVTIIGDGTTVPFHV